MGRLTPIANYLRRVLIEDIYGRLSKPARHAALGKRSLLNLSLFQVSCSPKARPGWLLRTSKSFLLQTDAYRTFAHARALFFFFFRPVGSSTSA